MHRKEKNEKDILYILDNLRVEDLHEVQALRGENFREEITKEIMESNGHFVLGVTKDDVPAVMGGLADMGGGVGCVWLLTTPIALKHQITLLRNLQKDILTFDENYWLTYNMLWRENSLAKKWLSHAGYRFPQDEQKKNIYDKCVLAQVKAPEGFEVFYRRRKVRGLS